MCCFQQTTLYYHPLSYYLFTLPTLGYQLVHYVTDYLRYGSQEKVCSVDG
jgi:hypothetical protein